MPIEMTPKVYPPKSLALTLGWRQKKRLVCFFRTVGPRAKPLHLRVGVLQIPNALGVDGARVGPVVGTDAPPHYRCLAEAMTVAHKVLVGITVAADSLNISGLLKTASGLTVLEHVRSEERRDFFACHWVFAEDLGEDKAVTNGTNAAIGEALAHASYFAQESLALLNDNSLRRGCVIGLVVVLVVASLRGGRRAGHDDVANHAETPGSAEFDFETVGVHVVAVAWHGFYFFTESLALVFFDHNQVRDSVEHNSQLIIILGSHIADGVDLLLRTSNTNRNHALVEQVAFGGDPLTL